MSSPAALASALAAPSNANRPQNAAHEAIVGSRAVRFGVNLALFPRQLTALSALAVGHSGVGVFDASTSDARYVAKVVDNWAQVAKPEELHAELNHARIAAEQGFGPRVEFL